MKAMEITEIRQLEDKIWALINKNSVFLKREKREEKAGDNCNGCRNCRACRSCRTL